MKSSTYFHINNIKFNYTLEFQTNHKNDSWKRNAPLIEYCETIGVNIPHYCYHKGLSISGNCRMCLVELKNSPKPIVSCAMSAKSCLNNSEIFTNSPLVKKARENVLEFLLLNHPLDCPICDQGGECDLQDQSLFFGVSKKRFYNFKRVVTDKNIGPIVKTVMTRCIHCTRCVRFATEIAGTEDLGMFGRGLDSEIGTYVAKTFQSELSGNIIDLCPVGALTSKPYPFVSRSWELKNLSAIDFSDGFAGCIQVYLKNNSIVKITPEYDSSSNNNSWISDKTRFAFDGMFSPERSLEGFITTGDNVSVLRSTWKTLLDEITLTLYFQDHLNKHFLRKGSLFVIFDNSISLEVLSLLMLFAKKYSFIKLRKSEINSTTTDLESLFLTSNPRQISRQLKNSDLCLLLGINTRYESSNFNIKLRKRYLAGNFQLFSFGSFTDLTIPTISTGLTVENLKSVAEGTHIFCQELSTTRSTIVVGSSILERKDSKGILKLLESMAWHVKGLENLNLLNLSLNEAGVKYLNSFESISENDLSSSDGLYFLGASSQALNIKKITNIKLLGYMNTVDNVAIPQVHIEQSNGVFSGLEYTKKQRDVYSYFNLPNNTFFESNGTFLNTEGIFKKNVKFVLTNNQTKEDWQIVRKIFSYSDKISYMNNFRDNSLVSFNNNNLNSFRNFIELFFKATTNLTRNYDMCLFKNISVIPVVPARSLKLKKSKIFSTKIKMWINDFYIGGKDPYSKYSSTMIKCSKVLRTEKFTFVRIN